MIFFGPQDEPCARPADIERALPVIKDCLRLQLSTRTLDLTELTLCIASAFPRRRDPADIDWLRGIAVVPGVNRFLTAPWQSGLVAHEGHIYIKQLALPLLQLPAPALREPPVSILVVMMLPQP